MDRMNESPQSLITILSEADPTFAGLIDSIQSLGMSMEQSTKDVTYRYLSHAQALHAYQLANQFESTPNIDTKWVDNHQESLAHIIRATAYDKGKVPHLLAALVWIKKSVISSELSTVVRTVSDTDAISPLLIIRSVFENIGATLLLNRDLAALLQTIPTDDHMKLEAISDAEIAMAQRGKGTRIDWETYTQSSLREGKKKSYKPKKDTVDLEAKDLLKGVDLLDKQVDGARKAYEFLSEFAHPNIGAHFLLITKSKRMTLSGDLILWERQYCLAEPVVGVRELHKQLREVFEILIESVEHFVTIVDELDGYRKDLSILTKSFVKLGMKNHPMAFVLREPCPCLSGKAVRHCCGASIRKIHKKHGLV